MASVYLDFTTNASLFDEASNTLNISGAGSAPSNRLALSPGDTLIVRYASASSTVRTVTVTGFLVSAFTSTSNVILSSTGATGSRITQSSANLDVTLTLSYTFAVRDPETNQQSGTLTRTEYAYLRIGTPADQDPDPVYFTTASNVAAGSYGYSNTVTVSGLSTSVSVTATNGGQVSISGGGWATSGTVVNGSTIQARLTAPSQGGSTSTITIGLYQTSFSVFSVDVIPDDFVVGITQYSLAPYKLITGNAIQVNGINAPVTASVTGAGATIYKINDPTPRSSITVNNKDWLYVKMITSGTPGGAATCTLTIGGLSRSWTVYTSSVDPNTSLKIRVTPPSLPVSLMQVVNGFGGTWNTDKPRNITAYVRGTTLVPNITENAGIPTQPPIMLSQFVNAWTAFYKFGEMESETFVIDTHWNSGVDIYLEPVSPDQYIGYGNIAGNCEYTYTLNRTGGQPQANFLKIKPSAVPGNATFSHNNRKAELYVNTPLATASNVEQTYELVFTVRHALSPDPKPTLTFVKQYTLEIINTQL